MISLRRRLCPICHDAANCLRCRSIRHTRHAALHVAHYTGHTIHETTPGLVAILCFEFGRHVGVWAIFGL